MSKDGNVSESPVHAYCGNCGYYRINESDGAVICIINSRPFPKPDDAPCGNWIHVDELAKMMMYRILLESDGMRITFEKKSPAIALPATVTVLTLLLMSASLSCGLFYVFTSIRIFMDLSIWTLLIGWGMILLGLYIKWRYRDGHR